MCVRVFKEQNNGHYFCTTCSRPSESLIVTDVECHQLEALAAWIGIGSMAYLNSETMHIYM